MNSLQDMVLSVEAQERNLAPEEIERLKYFASQVAEIESNNKADRQQGDDPSLPGKGKYQFETNAKGGSNSAFTANNRLRNWEKRFGSLPIPEKDRKELQKKSPDFSRLSEDTQDALFFINLSQHETAPLTELAKGKIANKNMWLDFHWAGGKNSPELIPEKEEMWDKRFRSSTLNQRALTANTFPEAMR